MTIEELNRLKVAFTRMSLKIQLKDTPESAIESTANFLMQCAELIPKAIWHIEESLGIVREPHV